MSELDRGATASEDTDAARSFALSEDWLATVVGLVVVLLALGGVIDSSWLLDGWLGDLL